jgi:hypothetical protein
MAKSCGIGKNLACKDEREDKRTAAHNRKQRVKLIRSQHLFFSASDKGSASRQCNMTRQMHKLGRQRPFVAIFKTRDH